MANCLIPKKLAVITDMTGYGRCSMTVALPVISALTVQACPVPTSIFSNHTAFPTWYFDDYTEKIPAYLAGFEKLSLRFDGIYTSFLGSEKQAEMIAAFITQQKTAGCPTVIVDPAMGDHGKTYATVTDTICHAMKELVKQAQVITPNLTEACLLTDTPYETMQADRSAIETIGQSEHPLPAPHAGQQELLQKLAAFGPQKIVITGIEIGGFLRNLIYDHGTVTWYDTPIRGESRHGTGDIFASVIAACAVENVDFSASVRLACDFIGKCTDASHKAGTPVVEGVLFERYLTDLKLP